MTIAVIGAFYLEKYEEAAIVIVLYNLAEKLEDFGIQQSKTSLSSLAEKMPKTALIKGRDYPVPVSQVKIDDVVVVKPGEMIPLDGKVLFGFTAVDEATITGEPIAKDKMVGRGFRFCRDIEKMDLLQKGRKNCHLHLHSQGSRRGNRTLG